MFRRAASLLALTAALAAACPAQAQRLAGARPDASTVEGGIWAVSDKAEQEARTKAELNADPALNAYVRGVMCKVAASHCADLRLYVMDRPFFNASMAPNGYAEVWSGLLLRTADEAELGFVLGHETSHFTQSHSLVAHQAAKNRANIGLAVSVAVAVVGVASAAGASTANEAQSIMDATGNLIDLLYLGQVAAYFRFSRQQEAEADRLGLEKAAAAGYESEAAAGSWRGLVAETQGSDFKRVRQSLARSSVFASHPLEAERILALETQAKVLKAGGERGRARHRAAIRPHLAAWLRDDLRRRDFGESLVLIDRLIEGGEDAGVLNFYRGEAYRLRRGDGDLAKARDAYLVAAVHPDVPAAVWRELGDIRRRDGDKAGAKAAYQSYLTKAPQAEDAWMVQDSLTNLEREN
ncbi:M48 family metallopeptidase [Phenylobacterium sp.]|uniref:M48 family metallopeptidase n=1 Tax=Phenylobacterium sp. TaxID=1871053 RepID=UPI0027355A72|nr:M48 family metallopeptidase [Phenylobacterium sp.]MDP3854124.1 M48 family metalloprotease [Phenylobacterium sp.]